MSRQGHLPTGEIKPLMSTLAICIEGFHGGHV